MMKGTDDRALLLQMNARFIGERTNTESIEHGTWIEVNTRPGFFKDTDPV